MTKNKEEQEAKKQNLNIVKLLSWLNEESEEYLTEKGKGVVEGFIVAGRKHLLVISKENYDKLEEDWNTLVKQHEQLKQLYSTKNNKSWYKF